MKNKELNICLVSLAREIKIIKKNIHNFEKIYKERWLSGLKRTLGKCVYCQRYRGFESHSLRQKESKSMIFEKLISHIFKHLLSNTFQI